MRISDSRYHRDSRRYALAYRFLRLNARTQTIVDWTELSAYRVRTLHENYPREGLWAAKRHRGVPPYQLASFSRNRVAKRETLTLAGVFQQMHLIPSRPLHTIEGFPNFQRGELLCTAYETFRGLVPGSVLTVDHAALLLLALARADEIRLARCPGCKGAMVADLLSLQTHHCVYCDEDADDTRTAQRALPQRNL